MKFNRGSMNLQRKKLLVCILASVLMLLLSIPSFAMNSSNAPDIQDPEEPGQTVQSKAEEQNDQEVQTSEPEEQAEEASGDEDVPPEADAAGSVREETPAEEKPETVEGTPEAPAEKVPVLKALPANNTKVSYTSAGSHPVKFTVKSGGYTFKGTCATLGVDNASSGKATVKRISNNSKIAKLVYYYGYKKGWWQGSNSTKKATAVLGFTDKNCTENAKQCIEALIQRDNMGWTAFWNARKVGKYRMYSTDSFMREINELYKKDVSKIKIPDDVVFEMFHGETSSSKQQDFYAWRYKEIPVTPNGFAAVEKVSADVSITN